MSTEQTQRTMDRYFDLMGQGADFGECYAPNVTWLVADTAEVIAGPAGVREYVIAVHATFIDPHTRKYFVGDGSVYLEGDCAAAESEAGGRCHYCVSYDLTDGVITSVRCYGLGSRLTTVNA